MGAIALLVFYSNYMVAPLIPAFSREFAVLLDALVWLVPGFSLAYGVSTLMYGALTVHGGSGTDAEDFRKAIKVGISWQGGRTR